MYLGKIIAEVYKDQDIALYYRWRDIHIKGECGGVEICYICCKNRLIRLLNESPVRKNPPSANMKPGQGFLES